MPSMSHRQAYDRCCEAARVLLAHGWPPPKVLDIPLGLSRRKIYYLAREVENHRSEIQSEIRAARELNDALESHRA